VCFSDAKSQEKWAIPLNGRPKFFFLDFSSAPAILITFGDKFSRLR